MTELKTLKDCKDKEEARAEAMKWFNKYYKSLILMKYKNLTLGFIQHFFNLIPEPAKKSKIKDALNFIKHLSEEDLK